MRMYMKMKHTPIALPVETSALLAAWLSVQPPPVFEGLGKVSSWRPESLSVAGILGTPYAFLFHQHGQSVRNVDHRKKDQEWSTSQGPTNSSALATWDVDTPKVYLMLWQEGEIAPESDLWQDILDPLPALILAFFHQPFRENRESFRCNLMQFSWVHEFQKDHTSNEQTNQSN